MKGELSSTTKRADLYSSMYSIYVSVHQLANIIPTVYTDFPALKQKTKLTKFKVHTMGYIK